MEEQSANWPMVFFWLAFSVVGVFAVLKYMKVIFTDRLGAQDGSYAEKVANESPPYFAALVAMFGVDRILGNLALGKGWMYLGKYLLLAVAIVVTLKMVNALRRATADSRFGNQKEKPKKNPWEK